MTQGERRYITEQEWAVLVHALELLQGRCLLLASEAERMRQTCEVAMAALGRHQ